MHSRRQFIQLTGSGVAAGALGASLGCKTTDSATAHESWRSWPIKLGVASYSLRQLSRADAIAAIQTLGISYVNIKSFHLPYESSDEEIAEGVAAFENAGLKIVGGGNNNIVEDDDAHVRMFFEYAKKCKMPLLVIAPTHDNLKRIEKFVVEYDIRVAIHNHGPEDKFYPAPKDALERIKDLDPRVGLCIDVGHTARTGVDVVEAIAEAGDRLLDLHMKDLGDLMVKSSQCIVGEGEMPVAGIFEQLKKMQYNGFVNLEYEIDPENPLPGMQRSFAFMRGVLSGLEI